MAQQIEESLDGLAVHTINLSKIYGEGQARTEALRDVCLDIPKGSFVAIVGASGTGKSTLLHLLAGLDQPTPQENQILEVNGVSLLNRSENWLANFRAKHVGFVLQFFGLLPTLTALENSIMAAYFGGLASKERRELAEEALGAVGLSHRLRHFPSQLSGGEKQRVAVARAIVNKPDILFADEPTGNLDTENGQEILSLLKELNTTQGLTVILVSHDLSVVNFADRVIELRDGRIIRDETPK